MKRIPMVGMLMVGLLMTWMLGSALAQIDVSKLITY